MQCRIVIEKFCPSVGKHVMCCNYPGNLKSLDFFSSQDLSMLDKTSHSFIEAFVLWRLVSAEIIYSGKE